MRVFGGRREREKKKALKLSEGKLNESESHSQKIDGEMRGSEREGLKGETLPSGAVVAAWIGCREKGE